MQEYVCDENEDVEAVLSGAALELHLLPYLHIWRQRTGNKEPCSQKMSPMLGECETRESPSIKDRNQMAGKSEVGFGCAGSRVCCRASFSIMLL